MTTATLDDLLRTEGKAELIGGKIVVYKANGHRPSVIAGRVFRSLSDYIDDGHPGFAFTAGTGFAVPELPSGRESFSPDASYYTGPVHANSMRFVDGPPDFAAEVRSENDYGPAAEAEMAAKRADYSLAGTKVVCDVDPVAGTVTAYRSDAPDSPTVFGRGTVAHAEPAVPGCGVAVDWLMR
jgi:Uma2 family endonuclease